MVKKTGYKRRQAMAGNLQVIISLCVWFLCELAVRSTKESKTKEKKMEEIWGRENSNQDLLFKKTNIYFQKNPKHCGLCYVGSINK